MLYAVDGVALGGWQLVDLALMALVAIELLSLIFLKVVIILLGALLYATGPIMIGLVATDSGAAIARAWASAVAMLIALPVVWATLFAVGALLVGDAGTAGPLIAGNSSVGSLLGGVLLAVAGAASLWMCLRAAREAMGLLRMQLGGLLALSHRGSAAARARRQPRSRARSSRCGGSARGSRRRPAAPPASWQLAGAAGATVVRGGRAVGYVARHGVLGTAAAGGRAAAGTAASARGRARRPLTRRRRRRANGEGRNCGLVHRTRRSKPATQTKAANELTRRRADRGRRSGARRQPATLGRAGPCCAGASRQSASAPATASRRVTAQPRPAATAVRRLSHTPG